MENRVFGSLDFSIGWKGRTDIDLFGKQYSVILKLKAYRKEDGVTEEQERAFQTFQERREDSLRSLEKALSAMSPVASARFVPAMLQILRDGELALLLDDRENPDEGLAAVLLPKERLLSQDDYL